MFKYVYINNASQLQFQQEKNKAFVKIKPDYFINNLITCKGYRKNDKSSQSRKNTMNDLGRKNNNN